MCVLIRGCELASGLIPFCNVVGLYFSDLDCTRGTDERGEDSRDMLLR